MRRKYMALLMVLVMIVTTLSGCGASQGSSSDKTDLKWWQKTVAYEIYVSSFNDSDGNGIGDLKGITEKLDYLQDLQVGAIWLTPVYASPMKDNGYDVSDYYEINPIYGNMDDMDQLIKEADKRDIKVVMDLVVNHTSDQCKWFQESCKGNEKYKDYYIWADAKADGSEPNNWRSIFGGSAWTWNEERGQYYLHTFLDSQPDLNWSNKAVRQEVYDVANYWVDKGVGGFRVDAVPYIKKPENMKDGKADASDGMVDIHAMTANTPGILDYLKEFQNAVADGKDIFTVGEANGVSSKDLPKWVGTDGVFDMIFEFNHFASDNQWFKRENLSTTEFKNAINASQEQTADNGWYPMFLENHDNPRSVSAHFPEGVDNTTGARALGTIMMTMRGTPFLYEGQELGMTNTTWSLSEMRDPNSKSQYDQAMENGLTAEEAGDAVDRCARDNARTPVQWTAGLNGGFTSGTPWIKVNPNYTEINAEAEAADPDSVLSWYQKLAKFRSKSDILLYGDYEPLMKDDKNIFAYKRTYEGKTLIVMVNFANETVDYDQSITDGAKLKMTNIDGGKAEAGELRPAEARIYVQK